MERLTSLQAIERERERVKRSVTRVQDRLAMKKERMIVTRAAQEQEDQQLEQRGREKEANG